MTAKSSPRCNRRGEAEHGHVVSAKASADAFRIPSADSYSEMSDCLSQRNNLDLSSTRRPTSLSGESQGDYYPYPCPSSPTVAQSQTPQHSDRTHWTSSKDRGSAPLTSTFSRSIATLSAIPRDDSGSQLDLTCRNHALGETCRVQRESDRGRSAYSICTGSMTSSIGNQSSSFGEISASSIPTLLSQQQHPSNMTHPSSSSRTLAALALRPTQQPSMQSHALARSASLPPDKVLTTKQQSGHGSGSRIALLSQRLHRSAGVSPSGPPIRKNKTGDRTELSSREDSQKRTAGMDAALQGLPPSLPQSLHSSIPPPSFSAPFPTASTASHAGAETEAMVSLSTPFVPTHDLPLFEEALQRCGLSDRTLFSSSFNSSTCPQGLIPMYTLGNTSTTLTGSTSVSNPPSLTAEVHSGELIAITGPAVHPPNGSHTHSSQRNPFSMSTLSSSSVMMATGMGQGFRRQLSRMTSLLQSLTSQSLFSRVNSDRSQFSRAGTSSWSAVRVVNTCHLLYLVPVTTITIARLLSTEVICDERLFSWLTVQACMFMLQIVCACYILQRQTMSSRITILDQRSRILMLVFMIWTIIGVGFLGADSNTQESTCVALNDPIYNLAFKIIVFHISIITFYFLPCGSLIVAHILPNSICSSFSRTATKPMIEQLGTIVMTEGMFGNEAEEATCAICLGDYHPDEPIRFLPCRHHFHQECVDQWLLTDKSCPLCKHDIDKPLPNTRTLQHAANFRFPTIPAPTTVSTTTTTSTLSSTTTDIRSQDRGMVSMPSPNLHVNSTDGFHVVVVV
ncbi:hypothetical protein BGW38_010562 [Lunasporangiospora selenospora]|uniref:RING-type domain-containing protein n=1 Tax=Lunasporangiospora selenospora TaxID=979761 RepID=A0A9P6FWD1_9FUNG|nr:hypothetical protein BGW38_010562 [Lunasporangiospora selenospora]